MTMRLSGETNPVDRLWWLALVVLLLSACDTSLQSPSSDSEGSGDEVSDSGPSDGDESDVADGTSDDVTGPSGVTNACGGSAVLGWRGAPAALLSPCGDFGEGVLVCAGVDALRCVGEATDVNACGSRGVLPVQPGTPCGVCAGEEGGGTWVCDGSAPAGLRCVGGRAPNSCGGCALLSGRPGSECGDGEGGSGRWVCDSREALRCDPMAINACGGGGALLHEGRLSRPGDDCDLPCGAGVLACGSSETLICVSAGLDPDANACGGCGLLAGEEGSGCGACDDGTWACHEGGVRCEGSSAPNSCGGCDGQVGSPGETCASGRIWRCDGQLLECIAPIAADERNACGGTVALAGTPGDNCGGCELGQLFCAGANRLECSASDDPPANWCACDGPFAEDAPCGTCGSGGLGCVDGSVRCLRDAGSAARNACGGCGDLPGELGAECGTCLAWACTSGGAMRCEAAPELEGCGGLQTCDDLEPVCSDGHRECIDSDGTEDAECGSCLPGYIELDGECFDDDPVQLSCSDIEPACADDGRACIEGSNGSDAACGDCLAGHVPDGADCRALLTCTAAGCAVQNRSCDERGPAEDAVCGGCLPGFQGSNGACVSTIAAPTNVQASDGTNVAHVRVTWSAVSGLDVTGYHVYRDGVRVTTSPVTGTAWNDTGATAAPVPEQVTGVSATTTRTDGVRVSWSAITPRPGPTTTYNVRTVTSAGESGLSSSATGYRAPRPLLRYEVRLGSGAWSDVGTGTTWDHADAPPGSVTLATPTATTDREDGVQLGIAAATVSNGAPRTYSVRAVNAAGDGPASQNVVGSRMAGTPSYQWQWAQASSGPWTALSGATSRTHMDTSLAPGAVRWYRVQVTAAGTDGATSTAVEGQRRAPPVVDPTLGQTCTTNGECSAGTWCPTNTPHRRCSPRPEILGESIPFVYVPAGTFNVGSPTNEGGRYLGGELLQEVILTRSFFVQQTPVTQAQWAALGGNDIASNATCGQDCPVENITWWSALWFANTLSEAEGLTPCYNLTQEDCTSRYVDSLDADGAAGVLNCGQNANAVAPHPQSTVYDCTGYRLLTAVEYERAVRAGTTGATWNGELNAQTATCGFAHTALEPIAWYCWNADDHTHPVREKNPNPWALFDMLGNTWEWVFDRPSQNDDLGTDPLYAISGQNRMTRGGSFRSMPREIRAANHDFKLPNFGHDDVGFRLARTVPIQ